MDKLMNLLKGEKAGRWVFIVGIAGIALIFLSGYIKPQEQQASANAALTGQQYSEQLEEKIANIVCGITGDKKAKVAVTLESGSEYVYANNTNKSTDLATTEDGQETSTKQNDSTEEEYIIINSGDGEQALVVTERLPKIKGVVIVADGADDEQTRQSIITAVTTVLDISSRKVYVAQAN